MKFLDHMEVFFSKSLIVEFGRVFGPEQTKKFLSVFGGMAIKVPSVKDIQRMEKEVAVFKLLSAAKTNEQRKILKGEIQAKMGLKRKDIDEIYKRMRRAWKQHQEAKSADAAVGEHKGGHHRK